MCGIVGFVDQKSKKEKLQIVKEMADKIIHRGPDGEGYYADELVALGHRRLSIIDIQGGSQPMYNKKKNMAIVFNGEIYNYEELKQELIKLGYTFQTKSDTEVILLGYEAWKDELFKRLRGMFAFVIYDKKNGEIVGARDHFGMKPFYYYQAENEFMFASEIKSMLVHPEFQKEINTDALKMYLIFQYSVKEETFFKNVYKLKPGHYFHYKNGKLKISSYFEITFERKKWASFAKEKKRLKDAINNSIYYHQTTSDVEVGSYLSGGIDSSYVVAVAKPKQTFSIGFPVKGFNETEYARRLSEIEDIKNERRIIDADDFFEVLPKIEWHADESYANLTTVPLFYLSELASQKVKVVLSGEGSDEMFAGYNENVNPFPLNLYVKIPLCIRKQIRNFCKPLPNFKGKNTLLRYGLPMEERYIGRGTYMESEEANLILSEHLRNEEKISDILKPYYDKVKGKSELYKKLYIDFHFWFPQDILLKADKMSMAHSIELRTPFVDKYVFEIARELPTRFLVKGHTTKRIFRTLSKNVLPKECAKRKKCGFPVPFSKWIQEEKYYQKVKDMFEKPFVKEFLNQEYILNLLDNHYQKKENNGRKIFNIYCFLIWYQVYFIE